MDISHIGGVGGSLQSFASPAAQFTDTFAGASGYGAKPGAAERFAAETGAAGMTRAFGETSLQAASSVSETAGKFFKELVNKVNDMQQQSDVAIQQLATGENRNLHETIIAVEKASISFQFMSQVRNKALEAYQEVMRMQV